jgi:hypothetical protein
VLDTRPYKWTLAAVGLLLLAAFSIYQLAGHSRSTVGVPAGRRLPDFVAPLAIGGPNLDANIAPRCDPAHPNLAALNVCGRTSLVLGLFVPGSRECIHQIDVIQAVAREFPAAGVQFAAVAVDAGRSVAARLVRSHGWRIAVAFDRDGAVGTLYGVSVCPMVELANRGGVVAQRLIGDRWLKASALAAAVRTLLRSG